MPEYIGTATAVLGLGIVHPYLQSPYPNFHPPYRYLLSLYIQ